MGLTKHITWGQRLYNFAKFIGLNQLSIYVLGQGCLTAKKVTTSQPGIEGSI